MDDPGSQLKGVERQERGRTTGMVPYGTPGDFSLYTFNSLAMQILLTEGTFRLIQGMPMSMNGPLPGQVYYPRPSLVIQHPNTPAPRGAQVSPVDIPALQIPAPSIQVLILKQCRAAADPHCECQSS
jgi:hypothetical protein